VNTSSFCSYIQILTYLIRYGYQLPVGETPGRWLSLILKKPKQARKKKQNKVSKETAPQSDEDSEEVSVSR
jgi:hypothetical protein